MGDIPAAIVHPFSQLKSGFRQVFCGYIAATADGHYNAFMILKPVIWVAAIAAALLGIAQIVPGIEVTGWYAAFITALVWGLILLLVRPILTLLTLPINFITLGLFSFVLNALLFWCMAGVVPGFSVSGFLPALEGSVLLTLVAWALNVVL